MNAWQNYRDFIIREILNNSTIEMKFCKYDVLLNETVIAKRRREICCTSTFWSGTFE